MRTMLTALGWALVASVAAGGWGTAYLVHRRATEALAAERAQAAEVAERVGSGCDLVYEVAWIERRCDGLAGWAPKALQAAACPSRIGTSRVQDLDRARKRIREAGPGTSGMVLLEHKGLRERAMEIGWEPQLAP